MKRRSFRLSLDPGSDGIVRLAQLHRFGSARDKGETASIGPALRVQVQGTFPRRDPAQVLDSLLGQGPMGWDIEGPAHGGQSVVLFTTEPGVAVSTVARILELVAPEALAKPIIYEPNDGHAPPFRSRLLH